MRPLRDRLSRLPLRIRLVAGFSVAMLVVLLVAGAFVYERVELALDRGLDSELAQATTALAPLVGADGEVSNTSAADATGVAWQVLDRSGAVVDHGGPAGTAAMIGTRQLDRVGTSSRTFDIGDLLPASHAPHRLAVTPLSTSPGFYLLVGVRRDQRDEALRELLAELSLAGLGALAVTALVGERLARAALRPVERYRRRAEAIAAGAPGLRLEVPARRDDEVTRLGHTLNDMLASLDQALERERQFVNEASHELRTPITLLTSRIQLARRRPRTQAEHERVLEELQVDLDRLARLAEQLLDLAGGSKSPPRWNAARPAADTRRVSESSRPPSAGCPATSTGRAAITTELPQEGVTVPVSEQALARAVPPTWSATRCCTARHRCSVRVRRHAGWVASSRSATQGRGDVGGAAPGPPPSASPAPTRPARGPARDWGSRSSSSSPRERAVSSACATTGTTPRPGRSPTSGCAHDDRMTVTVLLAGQDLTPRSSSSSLHPGDSYGCAHDPGQQVPTRPSRSSA